MRKFLVSFLPKKRKIAKFSAAHALLGRSNSYLVSVGWLESFYKAMPVDKSGMPLPWYTYAAITFLAERVNRNMKVFEYGSGNSTIWWASRVKKVTSLEHDAQWFAKMLPKLPENVEYRHIDLLTSDAYVEAARRSEDSFDVIVIDGRQRVRCAERCLGALRRGGVIVWDNSDRAKYQLGFDFLESNGFRRLDFCGIGPINVYGWSTSIFYKETNCLGI